MLHVTKQVLWLKRAGVSGILHIRSQQLLSWGVTDQLCRNVSIASLPNDVLLEIFSSYVHPHHRHSFNFADDATTLDAWHTLVHVCQRWRYVMFASPRHLNLRLCCTNKTPVRKRLRIWPELPLVVSCHSSSNAPLPGVSNIDAALKYIDRVCEINLFGVTIPLLKRFGAMDVSFPALTCLRLLYKSDDGNFSSLLPLPELFLGGIAPCLRLLHLDGIPFPASQKLLLSATNLITLRLECIPSSGNASPEAMAICLSTLTKLEELALGFRLNYRSDRSQLSQHPPPVTPTVLPALTSLWFRGSLAYLEILASHIRHPSLENVDITLFRQHTLASSRFREFIGRIETLELLQRADIAFQDDSVDITLSRPEGPADCRTLKFGILWGKSDHQPMYLSQFCRFSLPPLPTLEHLYIHSSFSEGYYIKTNYSLELLFPFASVKDLHVSEIGSYGSHMP